MFPNNPQQPNQPPVNPYQAQPPVMSSPEQPKSKKKLFIVGIIIAIVVVAGVLLWLLVFSSKSDSDSSTQKQANSAQNSSDLGKDCEGKALPDVGQWQEYLVARAETQTGIVSCGVTVGDLRATVHDLSAMDQFAISIWPKDFPDQPYPAHKVTVSNIEFLIGNTTFKVSEHLVSDSQSDFARYLEDAKGMYKTYQVNQGKLWQRAFGRELTFDEVYQAYSPSGNTFQIAPAFSDDECPECSWNWDSNRNIRFEIDNPEQTTVRAIKFDLTVDGKTKTVAFAVAQ